MSTKTRIFYFFPDGNRALGGVKIAYNHVEILNEAGFEAYALHTRPNTHISWFKHSVKPVYLSQVTINENDFFVCPEVFCYTYENGRVLSQTEYFLRRVFNRLSEKYALPLIAKKNPKLVIFNQNAYLTFCFDIFSNKHKNPYNNPLLKGIMAVSDDNKKYLSKVFPHLHIHKVHNAYDTPYFQFTEQKKHVISYMPRKNANQVVQVLSILKARGYDKKYTFLAIDGMNETEVAEALMQSCIFLSFGYPEGCPLPPAEAMLCGTMVVGYHGNGGSEYFNPEYCFSVEFGNIIEFAEKTEQAIGIFENDKERYNQMTRKAHKYIKETYTTQRAKDDVLEFWREKL